MLRSGRVPEASVPGIMAWAVQRRAERWWGTGAWGSRSREGSGHFRAPALRPSCTWRWKTMYSTSTGSIEMIRPANSWAIDVGEVS